MANNFFKQAREAVNKLTSSSSADKQKEMEVAKNIIHSAYTNSSPEEREQLQQLQEVIDQHETHTH